MVTHPQSGGFESWPELLGIFASMLASDDARAVEGALSALQTVCEDMAIGWDEEMYSSKQLQALIPLFVEHLKHPQQSIRTMAMACSNQFILCTATGSTDTVMLPYMDSFLEGVFAVAHDPSSDVRSRVCEALTNLVEMNLDILMPHMQGIVEYMLVPCIIKPFCSWR